MEIYVTGARPPVSATTLRRVVGVLGMLLPVLVVAFHALDPCGCGSGPASPCPILKSSISAYYDSCGRDVLVGVLFVVGWFLFAYRGYEPKDDLAGDLACVFTLGVALFPATSGAAWVRGLHLACGFLMFLVLAYFSLFLFTKSEAEPSDMKRARNRVYRACGAVILVCLALMVVYKAFVEGSAPTAAGPIFWLEAVALWAFGISWFVKGDTVLTD